jgi:tRNA uridine 5-carbamoylmethylation protein Kti12
MLRRLTARQFINWEIYDAIEPFGQLREDYRTAQIVSLLYNVNRGKHDKAKSVEDFLLKFEEPQPKQTWQEQLTYMKIFAAAQNRAYLESQKGKT